MRPSLPVSLALLALAALLGTALRLAPTFAHPGPQFLSDGATLARLAIASATLGRMPEIDPLAEAPDGRRVGRLLPPGLIVAGGAFHRALAALGSRDEGFNLMVFGALAGGLVAVPAFLWARAVFGAGWAAPIAALLAVFVPGHLHRSFGYLMRFDALGSLLVLLHLSLVAAAIEARERRSRFGLGVAAGLALAAAMWGWRVSLVAPPVVALFVAGWVIARGEAEALREWFTPMVVLASAAIPALEYLRAQRYVLSPATLAPLLLAAALWLAPARSPRRIARAALVVAAVALAFAIGMMLRRADPYATAVGLAPIRLAEMLGRPLATTPAARLMLSVEELGAVSLPALLVGPMFLSGLGPWLLLAPFAIGAIRGGALRPHPGRWSAGSVFLTLATVTLVVMALMFYRGKVLLAPLAAVVAAGLAQRAFEALRAKPPARRADRSPARGADRPPPRRGLAIAVLAGLALGAVVATAAAFEIVTTRRARLDPDFTRALVWLRDHRAGETPVVAPWGHGYEVEAYARRATVFDGLLESATGMLRIEAAAHASLAASPESLATFCRRFGALQLLVPPSTELLAVALVTDDPLVPALEAGRALTPAEADRALIRMMVAGKDEPPFRKAFERGLWRVYSLEDSVAQNATRR